MSVRIDHLPTKIPDIGLQLIETVGRNWLEKVSKSEFDYFIEWAAETQVYFYPGNEQKLGDAFRGFVMGIECSRSKAELE